MQEGRWTTITPSQFVHEREALAHIQLLLPDAEPYRAWSNFTFTADTGHVYEVDLLVAARGGLYLIEIKSFRGKLTSSGSNWILAGPNKTRTFDNPLHLADSKAKRLKSLLEIERKKRGIKEPIPFIQAAVFLSERSLVVDLSDNHLHSVYGPENGTTLPKIWSGLLEQPPKSEHNRVSPSLSKALPELLKQIGVARSRKHYQIGSWQLDGKPFDIGPTWQDHVARHAQLDNEVRRVRIYLVERNAVQEERASIERAAKREMQALHGINHPGIVQVDAMEQHEAGPALVFRYDRRALRLDHYLSQYGARLDVETRVGMVRQLAETIAYAHRRHLHHRALSARSVLVTPLKSFRGTEDEAWLRPHLQISDWHAASRTPESTRGSSPAVLQTAHVGMHLEKSSEGYLAPEFREPGADPVALDVFGLGTLAYLLLSNQPPATSRQELVNRLATDNGLRPSASADSVSEFMDEVVQAATAPQPSQRIATAEEFLELLETVEEEVTAPPAPSVHPEPEPEELPDLLEARAGDEIGGWHITKRLGTGSTSRAFLAGGIGSTPEKQVVLKVALSDEKASRLEHEARILRKLTDSRIIRLARQEPLTFGKRTYLVLEHAGDKTVARKLREDGRLTVDELETYSDYLFGAVDYLDGEGVHHRDIKPDNIAIRIRPNRTRQLVLFDFSLAAIDIKQIEAGTPRYLDPFLGTVRRPVYDDHAERYAVAVTLHEMASGELPVWGDGLATEAQLTDGPVQLASEAFDPAIRDGLIGFFGRALERDAGKRFGTLKEMRDAWQQVFHQADALTPVTTHHPEPTDEQQEDLQDARDREASEATRATPLEAAGLSPRAVSAAQRIEGVTTVGDLLAVASRVVFNLPGMGFNTRKELQQRIRQWRERLGEREASPLAPEERLAIRVEVEAAEREAEVEGTTGAGDPLRLGLDAVATRLVPAAQKSGRNASEVDATRLFLRLPDTAGALPDLPPWPPQPAVANVVGVTSGRIAQILGKQRKRWASDPALQSLRAELIGVLADSGRVMSSSELAATLLSRRGASGHDPQIRSVLALAAVRAAVEIDSTESAPRFLTRRHGERLLVALEVSPDDDAPDTPSAPRLLDYADALGKVADRLAASEVLPSPATVIRELAAVRQVPGAVLDERRMVQLAAVASQHAAASPRLEIYPRDLDPVRALRLAQAGVISGPADAGLTDVRVRERVAARFPDLDPLPGHPALDRLLAAAGFDLRWDRSGKYVRPKARASSSASMVARRRSTAPNSAHWTVVDSPVLAGALRAEEVLSSAPDEGFRALTVRLNRYPRAIDELARRFTARPTNVAALFMAALRARVAERAKPTWDTILRADTAEPGSRAALKLAEYTAAAWGDVRPTLLGGVSRDGGPLLLHEAALFARYDAMGVLDEVVSRSRDGHGAVWLLCPVEDPGGQPRLDGVLVPHLATEHVPLVDAWVDNEHRGAQAS